MNGDMVLFRENKERYNTESVFIIEFSRLHIGWRLWTSMYQEDQAVM